MKGEIERRPIMPAAAEDETQLQRMISLFAYPNILRSPKPFFASYTTPLLLFPLKVHSFLAITSMFIYGVPIIQFPLSHD
jgi:hypothetical protein